VMNKEFFVFWVSTIFREDFYEGLLI